MDKLRVLVVSHAHPHFSHGGGETAAYSQYMGYARHPDVEKAWFLAARPRPGADGAIKRYEGNEYLWEQKLGDPFYLHSADSGETAQRLRYFLDAIRPNVVHLHHGFNLGYEIVEIIRKYDPDIKIYFTLHEFLPICARDGQMLTTGGRLCQKASPLACQECFPDRSQAEFWMRKRRLLHYFSFVDAFITPSNFLQNRYLEWGIEPERIFTLENGLRHITPEPETGERYRNRFGFFGTVNPYKGLVTLFLALERLSSEQRQNMVLEINGASFEQQTPQFQQEINNFRKKFEAEGFLHWRGPYDLEELPARMAAVDWVVVPSTWWENSPVVIQESFACGRPVLASNIGGMAEKVRHDVNGLLARSGDRQAWADLLARASGNVELWNRLHDGITPPLSERDAIEEHLRLMRAADDSWEC